MRENDQLHSESRFENGRGSSGRRLLLIALLSIAFTQTSIASNISMSGAFTYYLTSSNVWLYVERIDNNDPIIYESEGLALQLWATTNVYAGGPVSGYKVAETAIGSLRGHQSLQQVGLTTYPAQPPAGQYYMTMVVAEWNGSLYVPDTWGNFTSRQLFGIYTPIITSPLRADAEWGNGFVYQITAANSPTGFNATSLPAGMHVDQVYGLIYGIPTTVGTNHVTISASNLAGTGSQTLTIVVHGVAPSITAQPTNQDRLVGQKATFSVGVSAPGAVKYQWQYYASNLVGKTTATLTLTNVQFANAGQYRVIASNSSGSVTSRVATLRVFCATFSPQSAAFGPRGGSGVVNITPQSSCVWSAQTNVNWISVTGFGSNSVHYSVDPNTASGSRTGTVTIAGQTFIVSQTGDTARPTISISSPSSGERLTNAPDTITVRGTAGDNVQVAAVHVRFNHGAWFVATTTNLWADWIVNVAIQAGTNVLAAYATDTGGRASLTNQVKFYVVSPSTLTVITNGIGSIIPSFSGNLLEVGRTYAIKAVPVAGQVFSNWWGHWAGGDFFATNAQLNFVMRSNLILTANIIPNPFLRAKGTYSGLLGAIDRAQDLSGYFSLTLSGQGSYSASLRRGTNLFSFTGAFDLAGNSQAVAVPAATNPWVAELSIQLAGAEVLTGTIGNNQWQDQLLAYRAVFDAATNPATRLAGKYTMIIPGTDGVDELPQGDSYGTLTVSQSGIATVNAFLADGRSASHTAPLSSQGDFPLYLTCFGNSESVLGWLAFDSSNPAGEIGGSVSWIRDAVPSAQFFRSGFTSIVDVAGSRYEPPPTGNRILALTNGVVTFEGGNLDSSFTNLVVLTNSNQVLNISANPLSMTLVPSSGLFSGIVIVPSSGQTNSFKGAVLQGLNFGSGFFLGTNRSGRVSLKPQ